MSLILKANKKLKSLNLDGVIKKSSKPEKKLVLVREGKTPVHFGSNSSNTFLEGASVSKRNAYKARHNKIILKDGTKAVYKKYSPAYMSMNILW
jgi:hypothetical protein